MERNNGCNVDMEDRILSGSSRLRSKVPRARFAPKFGNDFSEATNYECRNGGSQKIHANVPSTNVPPQHIPPPTIPQLSDTDEAKEWKKLLGERVCISGVKQGILRYYGRTTFAQGLWCGVELDEPVGKNNGTVNGVVYFKCRSNHGIFAPISKVSKLNDLSGSQDWQQELKQDNLNQTHTLDYNVRYASEELYPERKFIRTSRSDPTFLMNTVRTVLPHNSESFPYDDRRVMELREAAHSSKHRNKHTSSTPYNTSAQQRPTFNSEARPNITSNPLTACLMSRFGNKTQFGSKVVRLSEEDEINASARGVYRQADFLQRTSRVTSNRGSIPASSSFSVAKEEYESYFTKAHASSSQSSTPTSEGKHYTGMQLIEECNRLSSEKLSNNYLCGEFRREEDFMLVEDDDQMSMDCDESLGILTPNQMKDLTFLVDNTQPTSSDMTGMNFPSSESFDDINDLPEDEQVRDVTVHYLPDRAPAMLSLEVSKQGAFQKTKVNGTEFARDESLKMVSSTDKFLSSVSSKEFSEYNAEVNARSETVLGEPISGFGHNGHNNFSMTDILKSGLTKEIEKELTSHNTLDSNGFDSSVAEKAKPNITNFSVPSTEMIEKESVFSELSSLLKSSKKLDERLAKERCVGPSTEAHNLIDYQKLRLVAMEEDKTKKNNCDTDSSRDSLLHIDQEHVTSKEKLTVSWEDCVTHSDGFIQVERPESVYTVASNDTGYQEEYGEFDGDAAVMATSMDSTEDSKRFSTVSRDSCIVTEDGDGYKIAESNSTSGYSTGLSDSCCNDRHDDDSASCKPMTDESIQDSVGPCDSEDAFSLQESSEVLKDIGVEMSEVTETTETALFVDSSSDALRETMVGDSTLTDLHELLMSPDDNEATATSPKDKTFNVSDTGENAHNETFVVDEEKAVPVNSPPSTCKSTPEKKVSNTASATTNRSKSSARIERNQRASVQANNTANKAKKADAVPDRKKQIVNSPKRNVMSKIKAMIEATSCKTVTKSKPETEVPKRAASTPKKSRWDAVTSKIAASLAEEKTKPKVKRDIKSKVDTNLSLARQQATCRSPRLDSPRLSIREGSMSPTSVSSRDKRALEHRNSAPCSVREDRSKEKEGQKSPRPGKASRSTSPVAASESSTNSVSLHSHNSKSKIAQWKGSSSTVGSAAVAAVVAPTVKKAAAATAPRFKPPLQTVKSVPPAKMVTKKAPATVKSRPLLTVPNTGSARGRPMSPSGGSSTKADSTRVSNKQSQKGKEHGTTRGLHHPAPKPVRPPMWLSKAELTQEIQHLGNLCEARTKELNRLKMETRQITVGFDAFAALFKYMVEDLNALSVPKLAEDLEKTLKQLELTKQDLAYYENEVEELKAHHCQELTELSDKLFASYQTQVAELNSKHQEELHHINRDHQKQVENLSNNYNLSSGEIKAQHEKLITNLEQELIKQREELQMFHASEIKDLEERHVAGTKALQSHIEQLQKKCAELKQHSMSMEDAMKNDSDTKLQWVTSRKMDLEKEVESLKAVLEMKNKELHTIRVQNLEMDKQLEELPLARERIKMLQARAEDLEALMAAKTKAERELSSENHYIKETYERESKVNKRLSMENEELQWRLRHVEHSLMTDSLNQTATEPLEDEILCSTPMTPPPHSVSKSVFFTFVDKDDLDRNVPQSPGSQYKKISRSFSAHYKTSPAKTPIKSLSSASSPRRAKSNSEPPQPIALKATKQSVSRSRVHQKRQRCEIEVGATDPTVVTESMTSSVSSEGSVFEAKERLLEVHKDQIMVSLDILKEQQSMEEAMDAESPLEMTQSGNFTDPKTYYHMTFPVLKEPGAECDTEENSKDNSPDKEMLTDTHSREVFGHQASSPNKDLVDDSPVEKAMVETTEKAEGHIKATSSHDLASSVQDCQMDSQSRWNTM